MAEITCSKSRGSFGTRTSASTLNPGMSPAFRKYSDSLKVNAQAIMHTEHLSHDVLSGNVIISVPHRPDLGKELPLDIVRNTNGEEGQRFWSEKF